MPNCCVVGCNNSSDKKKKGISCNSSSDKKKKGISFHKLPKDPDQRAIWIKAIDRTNWEPSTHATVCSVHFLESDMDRTSLSCIRLREGVVPSLFDGIIRKVKPDLPNKKVIKTVKTEKISFEEVIKRRGKFKKELNEVKDELIKTRKEMKRLCQVKRRICKKINRIKLNIENLSLKDSLAVKKPKEKLEMELEDVQIRLNVTEEEIVTLNESRDSISAIKSDLESKLKRIPVPLKFKLDTILPSQDVNPEFVAAGSSKSLENIDDEGKNQKERPNKKRKIRENEESDGDDPEDCLQDPFGMIDIEEPIIKQEIYETEEFNETESERVLPEEEYNQEFEAVYCTPGIIKKENQDCMETGSFNTEKTNALVPEFMHMEIKVEPLVEEEEEEKNDENVIDPGDISLLWRCPLVSCSQIFSAELEMYQHFNMNHAGKGLPVSSNSKKMSGSRSQCVASTSVIKQPITPSIISPSTTASIGISGSTDLMFITTASSPGVSSVISVPTSQSVPSSSSGPITVTTTLSYSSLTMFSTPPVTTVSSSSSLSSVASASVISSNSSSVAVMSTYECSPISPTTSCPSASSSVVAVTTSDHSPTLSVDVKTSVMPSPKTPPMTSSRRHKHITGTTVSSQGSDPTRPEKRPPAKPEAKSSKAQPLHIFQPTGSTIECLPQSATDESEMFSISLSGFPQNRRVPIKRKLMEVVNCIRQNNISPDKLIIAYYVNSSDSRTM